MSMKNSIAGLAALLFSFHALNAQPSPVTPTAKRDTSRYIYDAGSNFAADTTPSVTIRDVNIVSFKNAKDWETYYKYKSRIIKVMPYVKIAKEIYGELKDEKETVKRRQYKHYRKDVEQEMRGKFEKELKDLSTSQGEMLFKLLNRETGNNAYNLIKETKGSFAAWMYQIVAKKWGYDLKEKYDPEKEKMIEMIIRELGPAYNVNS
jgi:hypothetical protein